MDSVFGEKKRFPSPPRRLLSGPRLPLYRHSPKARVTGAQQFDQKPRNREAEKQLDKPKSREVRNKPRSRETDKPRSTEVRNKPKSRETEKPRNREAENGQAEKPRNPTNDANEMNENNKDRRPLQQSRQPASATKMTHFRHENDRYRSQKDRFKSQKRVAISQPIEKRPKDKRCDSKTGMHDSAAKISETKMSHLQHHKT